MMSRDCNYNQLCKVERSPMQCLGSCYAMATKSALFLPHYGLAVAVHNRGLAFKALPLFRSALRRRMRVSFLTLGILEQFDDKDIRSEERRLHGTQFWEDFI